MSKFDPVELWLSNVAYSHSKSEDTAYNYRKCLEQFCNFIYCTPQQILGECERMTDREFRRKYALYFKGFISSLARSGYAVGTIKVTVASLKSFFKYNDLPLGFIPVAKNKIVYHNRDITKKEILKILEVSNLRDKTAFYVMAQSGLRPDTLRKLKLKHIKPDFEKGIIPCCIRVSEDITKGEFEGYFTFMGKESVKSLTAYLLRRGIVGPEDYVFTSKDSDKQLHKKALTKVFGRTVDKLKAQGVLHFEQEAQGKPRELRLYCLRKWFRNQAITEKTGIEYVNFWMGHRADYKAPHIPASDAYYFSTEDVEYHRQLYREHSMPQLRLETATPTETEKTIEDMRMEIDELRQENLKLKKRLNGYVLSDRQVSELLHRIEKLEKQAQKQK